MSIQIDPIGIIRTPYKQKFAIPRQPGLVKSAQGQIEFSAAYQDPNALRGIEQFSHIWLIFHFHQTAAQGWSPLVRPPRLGGNAKQGVFTTRSTFRPNAMGLSVVEFDSVSYTQGQLRLHVNGIDLLDGTPILDIKPYIPYADALPEARGGFANDAPPQMEVIFSPSAEQQLARWTKQHPNLATLITEVLAQDPRPAYKVLKESDALFGMNLYALNIQWQVSGGINCVVNIEAATCANTANPEHF
ncbi:MAG: tRNA-Thr(GGU) m(6)t(6)A37 methyltransferase TsaA [Paraglaciecola sp.]|jgi:tRNA-Thr(GGU) m(6)t(6)A37 methyltransferase TsaA